MLSKLVRASTAALICVASSLGIASAHSYPQTMDPAPNTRLAGAPQHVRITYDSDIVQNGTSIALLDASAMPVPAQPEATSGRLSSVQPTSDLAPGPYTVAWTSVSADDGHTAKGFYTFVVNGGPVGIIDGQAQAQAAAADLMATLTVTSAPDGSSLVRADLDNTADVERVRIQLSRPDLGIDLLDTKPSGDGGWILNGNEIALPGAWHAQVIVRRTNVVDDAKGSFDFTVDGLSGAPTFASGDAGTFFSANLFAHAMYASSTPAANASISAAPATVQITFTQELSDIQISVTGPDGSSVTTGQAKFDLAQRHNASVAVRDAGAGVYTVVWHNVSGEDGDSNDGAFVFTVAGAAPAVATTPAQTSAPTTTTTTTAAAATPACIDNGVHTPGISDVRVDTYCKREAIRRKYQGQIDLSSFNDDLAAGKGLESALADAMADYQKLHTPTAH